MRPYGLLGDKDASLALSTPTIYLYLYSVYWLSYHVSISSELISYYSFKNKNTFLIQFYYVAQNNDG